MQGEIIKQTIKRIKCPKSILPETKSVLAELYLKHGAISQFKNYKQFEKYRYDIIKMYDTMLRNFKRKHNVLKAAFSRRV